MQISLRHQHSALMNIRNESACSAAVSQTKVIALKALSERLFLFYLEEERPNHDCLTASEKEGHEEEAHAFT